MNLEKDYMKAAFIDGINCLNVRETPIPKPSIDDILLKVDSCGICGSDIRILSAGHKRVPIPQIMGHEIAGTIIEVGANQKNKFKVGDRIALSADVPCGSCYWCKNGQSNHCVDNIGFGHEYQGGFAEYLVLNKRILQYGPVVVVPPDSLKTQDELSLSEPLACCINGIEMCNLRQGDDVLIFGAGPIGCMLAKLSKSMGARYVVISDIDSTRLKFAKVASADRYITSDKNPLESTISELTGGFGFDVIFTACSSINAQEAALHYTKNGGYVNFFGGLPPGSRNLVLNSNDIHYRELRVLGSHGTTPKHHQKAVDMILNDRIRVSDLITSVYPLDKINEAFLRLNDKQSLKIIINP